MSHNVQTKRGTAETDGRPYIVADGKRPRQLVIHAGVFHRHESRVDDNAQRYKQVDERVHDEQLDEVRELVPAAAALPAEQQLVALALQKLLLAHALLEAEKICDNITVHRPVTATADKR